MSNINIIRLEYYYSLNATIHLETFKLIYTKVLVRARAQERENGKKNKLNE